uniref:Si:dkeyp-86f7.4 n=1 Tax=Sinocyclocheilus anshuiensis TaxID=1608454 RepID=A0A671RGQ2_9TELE
MKANLKLRAVHGRSCIWLSVLVFQYCFQLSASLIYWTAYVEVRYFDSCGMFGADSPLDSASGLLVLPNSDPLAWNCTYSQKIRAAQREGASAVVIYNIDGTGNNTDLMAHSGADDIVAIMVGNILGKEMANLVKNGSDVYVEIVVANPHGLWYSSTWVYALSFTFIGISTITMFIFAFLFIKRMYRNQQLRMQEVQCPATLSRVQSQIYLEERTLRTGDPVLSPIAEAGINDCVQYVIIIFFFNDYERNLKWHVQSDLSSDQVRKPATMHATVDETVESEGTEESPAYCTTAEGELRQDSGFNRLLFSYPQSSIIF